MSTKDNQDSHQSTGDGSCLCGAVSFTLEGIDSMSHCHCSMCRKIHGSAFATYLNARMLRWTSGSKHVRQYESSPNFVRAFCDQCGSVLPHASNGGSGYAVPAGLLNSDPGIRASKHIFAESVAPWYRITDKLEQVTHYGDDDPSRVVDRPAPASSTPANPTDEKYYRGGCVCGKVSFRYRGKAEIMMNCHCSRCRKAKGAAHATNLFVKPENFEWISGEASVIIYDHAEATRFGNSFCAQCGSSVPRKSDKAPTYNIPAGSLDDDPALAPKANIYVGSMATWYDITDSIPQHEEMPG